MIDSIKSRVAHYELLEFLGAGAMGEVHKALDLRLGREVAIKFVTSAAVITNSDRRLIEEARAAARVNHPNIATVYDLDQEDGKLYIVMEYVEGRSLSTRLQEGPLSLEEAIDISIRIADALSAAHASGLIHCDLKPANVMLCRTGVKVLDFGLAKLTSMEDKGRLCDEGHELVLSNSANTTDLEKSEAESDCVTGTLAYMSPDQLRGASLDARTDLFSAGVLIYEMVAGRRPFEADRKRGLIGLILNGEPPPMSTFREDTSLELERIVRKALKKDRDQRYQSASELLADLRALSQRTGASAKLRNSSDIAPATGESVVDANLESARAGRFGIWLPAVAAICVLAAIADFIVFHPSGIDLLREAFFLIAAAVAATLALKARRFRSVELARGDSSGAAFRGLVPFQETDRDRFFGRETEAVELLDRLAHRDMRFGVLYGDSGSGKTSLLRAGVIPALWERGFAAIYCRSYKEPLAALVDECRRQTQLTIGEDEPPTEYLRLVSNEMGASVVVIWDQFEEFFVSFKTRIEREQFLDFITACHQDTSLRVKILLSIRSDFLHLIWSEFSDSVSDPLASSRLYHLCQFDREQATKIIERSAETANLRLDPDLSRAVARDLASGDSVLPSELQIVGERLQTKRIYTVQAYKRAGGKEQLVHGFLDEIIVACGDGEAARLFLRCMISDENTRLTLTLAEISRRMQRSKEIVKRLITIFVSARLVRVLQDEEPWRYELMHEYLIERINQITGKVMDATQRANRLLRQYVSSYSADKRTRIPLTRVLFIRRYSDIERGERERELLTKSQRWGALKALLTASLILIGGAAAAAALSINEQWDSVRLSDGHIGAVLGTAFSPDGRLLLSCGEDSKVIVWDFAKRQRLATLSDHAAWVSAVAFSPDGKIFVTGSDDRTIIVWNASTLAKIKVLSDELEQIKAAAFSRDGKFLTAVDFSDRRDRTIVWRVDGWQRVYEMPHGFPWGSLVFSHDNRYVTASNGLYTLDLITGKPLEGFASEGFGGNGAAISPDGRTLVSVNSSGAVAFTDYASRKILRTEQVHRFHGRAAAFSPDGRLAATAAEDIVLWDAATRTKILRLEHTAEVWSLAFSPDGRWLVAGYADGAILIWDVAEREAVANLSTHIGSVRSVAFSPDGKRLATASEDRSIIVWNVETGQKEAVLIGHQNRITSVMFSPDGKFVASSDQRSQTIYWNLSTQSMVWNQVYLHPRYNSARWTSGCISESKNSQR